MKMQLLWNDCERSNANFFGARIDFLFDLEQFFFREKNFSRIDDLKEKGSTDAQRPNVDIFASRRAEPGT